ncbi:hypothetical protein [Conchiformibius kuhniae]|uniref:Uncharacterized protein n=1 Tax=Conchiformibius kuhniae TaxID=211502 RepID=A0A8T9MSR5_9NEIS|nr:hypothetical protein [Conchiformibius kuhniae]UOP04647.1 hypothetical protein LVJ77_10610 [Conchiformibius kuhniae]
MWKHKIGLIAAVLLFAAPLSAQEKNIGRKQPSAARAKAAEQGIRQLSLSRQIDEALANNPVLVELKKLDPKRHGEIRTKIHQQLGKLSAQQTDYSLADVMRVLQSEVQPVFLEKIDEVLPYADDDALKHYTRSFLQVMKFLLKQPDSSMCFAYLHNNDMFASATEDAQEQERLAIVMKVASVMQFANLRVLRHHDLQRKLPDEAQVAEKILAVWEKLELKHHGEQQREWLALAQIDGITAESPPEQQRFFCEWTHDMYQEVLANGDVDVLRYLWKQ